MIALSDALPGGALPLLKELLIGVNSIGDEGMLQLARVLATNTTITKIDLYGEWGNACEGAPQGWAHAMQALTERGSTTTLAMATLNDVLHGHVAHSLWVGRDSELLLVGPGV